MQFVDEEHDSGGALTGGLADGRKKIRVKIAAVGKSGLGFNIDADFDVLIFHLERLGETRQCPHALQQRVPERLAAVQAKSVDRSAGISNAGSNRPSGISVLTLAMPHTSASRRMRLSKTVSPTPRNP